MHALLAAAAPSFQTPTIDWHAFAPEVVLAATFVLVLLVDLFADEGSRWTVSSVAGLGILAAGIPVVTLAVSDVGRRTMFGGAFVVDDFSLVMTGVFLVAGYLTVLLSTNYIADGDYWEGEYYLMLVASLLGMAVMASARDLISIFVALELLSIPAYLLAGWRKRELKGNEAGMKYYLMGVFASAVMLYGFSLIFGVTGTTLLRDIGVVLRDPGAKTGVVALGIVFSLVGFAFKVSAVPFHNWAPDTYEGAPTPITAFLSVASKAAGFVAMLSLIFVGFYGQPDIWQPFLWVLAALTMTVGNVIALRQTNVVRMLAYSSVAQAGFMLAPLAVAGANPFAGGQSIRAVVTYLVIYTVMNLGAFAVVITVSRRTGTGDMESWDGLSQYAPGLAITMGIFLVSLTGIPPLGGWFAKFQVFLSLVKPPGASGKVLAVVVAVNSVIAAYYYLNLARRMFFLDPPDGDRTPIQVPFALATVLVVTVVGTVLFGVFPGLVGDLAKNTSDLLAIIRP